MNKMLRDAGVSEALRHNILWFYAAQIEHTGSRESFPNCR